MALSSNALGNRQRQWYRDHFHDHPLLHLQGDNAYHGVGHSRKPKLWCKYCFAHAVVRETGKDLELVGQGALDHERDSEQIQSYCALLDLFR
jgi:hypothetical protein